MILGRLYTIIFAARVQEITFFHDDVKKLVAVKQGFKGVRDQEGKGKRSFTETCQLPAESFSKPQAVKN